MAASAPLSRHLGAEDSDQRSASASETLSRALGDIGRDVKSRTASDMSRRPSDGSQNGAGSVTPSLLRRSRGGFSSCGDAETMPRINFDTRSFVRERRNSEISNRYDNLQQIGSGGCGKIYIAKDRMFKDRSVCVKQILKPDDDNLEALRREVDCMKNLDHPSICRLFETYDQQRFMFFVIEYCEGGDLFDRFFEKGKLEETELAGIIRQVASAMKYAHGRGIAHRDLKPENVCFCSKDHTSNNHVKVIDWGYGKFFGQGRMKSNVGTSSYAAPEVFAPRKNDHGYTSTCDLWSLGVVAYVSLTGKQPFWGSTKEQLKRMKAEQFPLEGPAWDGVSQLAKDFIKALLKWQPAERLSADCVLSHPWLLANRAPAVDPSTLHEVFFNMEQFSRTPDFFSLCVASVARQVDHGSLRGIREVFCMLDSNGDGVLELDEVRAGFAEAFGSDSELLPNVSEMFSHLDLDGTGKITYTEFCASGLGEQGYTQEHVLWAAFKTFDIRDDGQISLEELQSVLSKTEVNQVWSESVCQEVAREVMDEFGGGDGNINFQDWLCLMRECVSRQPPYQSKFSRQESTESTPPAALLLPKSRSGTPCGCLSGLGACAIL